MISKRRQHLRAIAAVCLVVALILLLWNRHGAGKPASSRHDRQTEKPQRNQSVADASTTGEPLAMPPASASEPPPRQLAQPTSDAAGPDYETDEFTHVPDWMPRPVHAVSAAAEEAWLRSDGFVEGNLRYTFGPGQTDALEEIIAHLEAAEMTANEDRTIYSSEIPPRRSEILVETAPDGGMVVSLAYQGIDHEKGCTCPTCGGSAKDPEP